MNGDSKSTSKFMLIGKNILPIQQKDNTFAK